MTAKYHGFHHYHHEEDAAAAAAMAAETKTDDGAAMARTVVVKPKAAAAAAVKQEEAIEVTTTGGVTSSTKETQISVEKNAPAATTGTRESETKDSDSLRYIIPSTGPVELLQSYLETPTPMTRRGSNVSNSSRGSGRA